MLRSKGIKANRIWGEKRNYRTVRSFSVSLCVFVFSLVTEVLAESTEKQLSWREANSESELFRMDGICEKFCPTPFFQLAAGAVLQSEDNSNESMLCNLWNNKRLFWKELYYELRCYKRYADRWFIIIIKKSFPT